MSQPKTVAFVRSIPDWLPPSHEWTYFEVNAEYAMGLPEAASAGA